MKWDKVEIFIKGLGFSCDDEDNPIPSRHYRRIVNSLEVILNPCFAGERGRLRFEGLVGWVYRSNGDYLFCFNWLPGQVLSQAMDKALQKEIKVAEDNVWTATKELRKIRDIHNVYLQSLADWAAIAYPIEAIPLEREVNNATAPTTRKAKTAIQRQ